MKAVLTPIERCKEVAGLAPHEIVLGVSPSEKHEQLLAKYRRARRSQVVARAKVVADIRAAVATGATREAADLVIVLRRLLALGAPRPPGRGVTYCARRRGSAFRGRAASRVVARSPRGEPEGAHREAIVLHLPERPKSTVETVV